MKKSKTNLPSVVLIGSGNVATQLGLELKEKGFAIAQVYSPKSSHASKLADILKTHAVSSLKKIDTSKDLYIIAVKDDSIVEIAKTLRLGSKLVVHTSGSVKMDILKSISENIGVFYPLQTFSKDRIPVWKQIPLCLESNSAEGKKLLAGVAMKISDEIAFIESDARKQLHLAAVFANNFSNHMYVLAEGLLKKQKLPFRLLIPLILETSRKAAEMGPQKAQTGPALRSDAKTLKAHLKMLEGNAELHELYALISKSIQGR
jgi:predicted short-subunit dehydrogenase-like oxidoreductase (DUF2520 family)